jgi:hypothetical protein
MLIDLASAGDAADSYWIRLHVRSRTDLRVFAIEEEGVGTDTLERCEVARKLGFEVNRPNVPVFIASGVLPFKQTISQAVSTPDRGNNISTAICHDCVSV